jgi:hypothetical protein
VFSGDLERGEQLARRLTAGSACVNDAVINYAATELPFGGANESGVGVRHGAGGIQKYCQVQAIAVTRPGLAGKRELYHFPYKPSRSKLLERISVTMYGRVPKKYRKR